MQSITMTMTIAAFAIVAAGPANAQEALAKSSGCLNCHATDAKKIGPSFKETAAKFKGKPDAEAAITAKLTAGKEHPATKASPDDVKALVKWILAM